MNFLSSLLFWSRFGFKYGLLLLFVLFNFIFLRLVIAHYQAPHPQVIFILGASELRERYGARFAHQHLDLPIWVSSGSPPNKAKRIFQSANISESRVNLDYRATDTVTNFTSLVETFKQNRIQHVYLITSDYHLPRSRVIAFLIFGSKGITVTPVAISHQSKTKHRRKSESILKTVRDSIRSLMWILTGLTGASLEEKLNNFQSQEYHLFVDEIVCTSKAMPP